MKPFNLEEAKKGAPVCTRDGRSARIVCWDTKNENNYQIVALIDFLESDGERIATYKPNGQFVGGFVGGQVRSYHSYDLFMAEEEHYDIGNFKPFDKVLVRDTNNERWRASFFSHYRIDDEEPFIPFVTLIASYVQCIPYNEETAHLVGTTDMPPKKYINW